MAISGSGEWINAWCMDRFLCVKVSPQQRSDQFVIVTPAERGAAFTGTFLLLFRCSTVGWVSAYLFNDAISTALLQTSWAQSCML